MRGYQNIKLCLLCLLSFSQFIIFFLLQLHTTNEVIKSDILKIRPTITPDPPQINVTVIGLEERRQIEKVTCDLVNQRDRLINVLAVKGNGAYHSSLDHSGGGDDDMTRNKAAERLAHVEEMLDECLASLSHYTGEWGCRGFFWRDFFFGGEGGW